MESHHRYLPTRGSDNVCRQITTPDNTYDDELRGHRLQGEVKVSLALRRGRRQAVLTSTMIISGTKRLDAVLPRPYRMMKTDEISAYGRAHSISIAAIPVYALPYSGPNVTWILLRISRTRATIMSVTRSVKAIERAQYGMENLAISDPQIAAPGKAS